jgi:HAD superfamily hydrolase (TIGR01484 family)
VLPLSALGGDALTGLKGILADIDDTLTTDGRLPSQTLAAIEALTATGLRFIPVTGRPAGWCDHIARMWPVDAVVGENGAFYMAYDRAHGLRTRLFAAAAQKSPSTLRAIGEAILTAVPGAAWSSDQPYRLADIAIDFCEDVPPLPRAAIEDIAARMRAAGLTAKISSIHVNGWFGDYDKLSSTLALLAERYGEGAASAQAHYLFIGDSANDVPMFGYFPMSVGVANVRSQLEFMEQQPKYITVSRSAAGFAELAAHVLRYRTS